MTRFCKSGGARRDIIPKKNGAEWDAFTAWRRYLGWRPGVLKSVKRGYNKRRRKSVRLELARKKSKVNVADPEDVR